MCDFFSVTSDGKGNICYFDWELRKKCLSGELNYNPDSHTSINSYFGFKGANEDNRNKYEYNPLTKKFVVDAIHGEDDKIKVEILIRSLDFETIIPQLTIKNIINPFKDIQYIKNSQNIILLLQNWDSVRDSVEDSVRDSVWDSIIDSVRVSVWDSIEDSVWDSVEDSIRNNVGYSVWYRVRDSIRDSVGAYISSFFRLEKQQWKYCNFEFTNNPFQSCIDLWEMGIVPSFDGITWRLHAGIKAEIILEISQNELRKYNPNQNMKIYSTDEFAKKINVSTRTLYNWNKNGLMLAHKKPSGKHFYTEQQYIDYMSKK